MKQFLSILALLCCFNMVFAQMIPFTQCPDFNIRTIRTGFYWDPFLGNTISTFSYQTGKYDSAIFTGVGGYCGSKYSADVDAIGLNTEDGFIYGFSYYNDDLNQQILPPNSFSSPFFSRTGTNGAVTIGNYAKVDVLGMPTAPPMISGENQSIVKRHAGDVDQSDNYFFTAQAGLWSSVDSYSVKRLFLGKISNISTMPLSSCQVGSVLTFDPYYVEITNPGNDAKEFMDSVKRERVNENQHTWFRDIAFNPADGKLYSYVVWPGVGNWLKGQLVKIDTASGVLSAVTAPTVIIPPKMVGYSRQLKNDVIGCCFDMQGNFLVGFMDRNIYRVIQSNGVFTGELEKVYTDKYTDTYECHGDMASCLTAVRHPVVPVKISLFTAGASGNDVLLNWNTANEINVQAFIIERSLDALHWEKMATLAANGTASGTQQYSYVDRTGLTATAYYRLVTKDISGEESYSEIRKVSSAYQGKTIKVYPNPVHNTLSISSKYPQKQQATIIVTDVLGRSLCEASWSQGSSNVIINVSSLPSGVYYLKITNANTVVSQKFKKE